ncbi:MAG: peptide chain release factor 1 [Endomicrobium sp.]|nr:peptide chain release factor 1 [Endomicrobium sp.]
MLRFQYTKRNVMFLEKLKLLNIQFLEIEQKLSCYDIASNNKEYKEFARKYFHLRPFAEKYMQYLKLLNDIEDIEELKKSKDIGIKEMALLEHKELVKKKREIELKIKDLLVPSDSNKNRDVIIEIRAGVGGDEAALFVGDLYKMYVKFAERNKWNYEILGSNPTGIGGYKEIILEVKGNDIWRYFKFERGIHRVQRVPKTEADGRVHTSTVSVAVLFEAKEIDIEIKAEDLKIDTYRASGAGGQHVNKTDSAIRITHLPTGNIIVCQDERSQLKNKEKALKILRARLYELKIIEQEKQLSIERKKQVGSGDRSEKIRTYNFQQNRITDHRISYSTRNITDIMNGNLLGLINELIEADIRQNMSTEKNV